MGASFTGYAVTDIGVPDPQWGRTLRARDDDPSLFRPSLGQEDRSAPVRVCCVRSVCLLGRERVIASSAARRPQPPDPAGQRRRRMATVETLEGRTLLSNVVTSFTHDAITGAV